MSGRSKPTGTGSGGPGFRQESRAKDKRRKHHNWQVTVYYHDGEKFGRVYVNREKARRFAERQKKSAMVERVRLVEVD